MRLRLSLEHKPKQILPLNYQYLISSWIYRTLGNADSDFARNLHEKGYDFGGKRYKFFTFDSLQPQWYDIDKRAKTFILTKSPTILELSFHIEDALQNFVVGLFKNQSFSLSSGKAFQADFKISGIELQPKPIFTTSMRFSLQTPLCISQDQKGEKYAQYLHPENEAYPTLLIQNLIRKQRALQLVSDKDTNYQIELPPIHFQLLSTPKKSPRTIKGIKLIGYVFDFELSAPTELSELGYYAGFGEKNSSLGMGMANILY